MEKKKRREGRIGRKGERKKENRKQTNEDE